MHSLQKSKAQDALFQRPKSIALLSSYTETYADMERRTKDVDTAKLCLLQSVGDVSRLAFYCGVGPSMMQKFWKCQTRERFRRNMHGMVRFDSKKKAEHV